MAVLTIKDLDGWIYERIRERAKRNRRSITAEAAHILEQGVTGNDSEEALLAQAQSLGRRYRLKIESHEELLRTIDEGRP